MSWDVQPRGVGLNDTHNGAVIPYHGCDFAIAGMGRIGAPSAVFTDSIQAASNADVPFLGLLALDTEPYHDSNINNMDSWAGMEDDLHIKLLEKMLESNGVLRKVHGLIFDIRKTKNADGNTYTTSAFVKAVAQHVASLAFKKWGLPIWFFETMTSYNSIDDSSAVLSTWLSQQPEIGSMRLATVGAGDWGNLPYPSDTWTVPYCWCPKTTFVYYNTGVQLTGVANLVELWLYNGNKQALYSDLNFVASSSGGGVVTPGDDDDIPGDDTPGTGGGGTVDVSAIVAELKRIGDVLNRVYK